MSGRATEALLDSLHGLLADALLDELKLAIARTEDIAPCAQFPTGREGIPLNPQLLDKVMKFLKDNGVASPKGSPKVDALAAELTDLDLDEEVLGGPRH